MQKIKFLLEEKEIPRQWYNILADMPGLPPPLDPITHKPVSPASLEKIFPANLVEHEIETKRWVDIPEEVIEKFLLWRPTPLCRAVNFEKALDTPAKIFYKNESLSPAGSHKVNSAIAQAYYSKAFGIKRLTTETGAGQWGSALSFACQLFNIALKVYMVKVSFHQKPFRKTMMKLWGAQCVPSPSPDTEIGRKILREDPDNPGSLGIAISEAIEDALQNKDTRYSLGSVLNFVCLHQTIIGLEAEKQLKLAGIYPDIVIGCVGGGSNFAGIAAPFIRDKINGKKIEIIGVEPQACPTMTRAPYIY
ncbi:MAG TPA: TrpB-like pyridoxal phosphate-dependent enzyme, partial [Victivallales bacterium]|nr:TrpB-like pyridoxal phosphate-dependent enzyme [Victivallales bacterium]